MATKKKSSAVPKKRTKKAAAPEAPRVLVGESGPTEFGWHSLEAVMRCMKEYQLYAVRKVRTLQVQTPDALGVGAMFHAYRAKWFASNFATDAAALTACQDAALAEAETMQLPVSNDAKRRTLELGALYVENWAKRPLPSPVAVEHLVGPTPIFGDNDKYVRTARLDDVSVYPEAGGKLAIGECKTTSSSPGQTVSQYTLHGQPLLQLLLWKLAPQGEAAHGPVSGYVLDVVKKPYEKTKPAFARQYIPVSDEKLTWYAKSLAYYVRVANRIEWDTEVPRNTAMCTRAVGGYRGVCQYRDLCNSGRSAAFSYLLEGGQSLLKHQPEPGKERMPWE